MAKAESKDTASAEKGGDLGCDITQATGFVPEFLLAVFAQPVGEVGAPVKTEFGYHLIKVTSRNVPPYEQVAAQARRQVTESGQDQVLAVLAKAVQGSKIEVNPKYGPFRKTGNSPGVVPPQSNAPTTAQPESAGLRPIRLGIAAVGPVAAPMGRVVVVGLGPAGRRPAHRRRHVGHRAHPPALPPDDPSSGGGRGRARRQLRRRVRVGDVARRRLRRHRRHTGRGGTARRPRTPRCSTPSPARRWWPSAPSSCCWPTSGSTSSSCPGCRSPTWRGPGCVSTRWRPACASSTATGSRWRRRASGGRCWWPSATPATCCRRSSCRSTARRRPRWSSCPGWACPTSRCAPWPGTTSTGRWSPTT